MCKKPNNISYNSNKHSFYYMLIAIQIVIFLPILNNAQDLLKRESNFNIDRDYTNNYIIDITLFDELKYRLNNKNSLLNNQTFLDIKNHFQNRLISFSNKDTLGIKMPFYNYYNNSTNKLSGTLQSKEINNSNDFFYIKEKLYNKNFIESVDINFFYDNYSSNKNSINTSEFSVLSFQSAEANQYLSGTKIWGGIGFAMFGTLMILPRSVTKWEENYIENATSNFNRAFSEPPVWDEDHWEINYIGHPYAGSLYYNTIRSQGGTMLHSFIFSAFVSTGWEYLYEGMAEQPSIQDLIVTPVVGSILGEVIHQATLSMKKGGYNFWEAAFVTIFNPMDVIQNGYK